MVLTGLNQVGDTIVPSEGPRGEAVCLPVLASIVHLHSLAHGPISVSLNQHGLANPSHGAIPLILSILPPSTT